MLPDAADGDVVVDGNDGALRLPGTAGDVRPWAWATAGFALLWLVTLVWALQRRPRAAPQRDGRAAPSKAGTGLRALKRVLDCGGFREVAEGLLIGRVWWREGGWQNGMLTGGGGSFQT